MARLIRSELTLPKDLYTSISIYLLFALGLKGGVELAHSSFEAIAQPAGATILLGCITPLTTYAVMKYVGRFDSSDAAAMAAHYGSVSAVTF
ncbi:MAG: sodium-dependent bicarbonate transport family permease, partial [Gemmatimonadaceae bacterium]